MTEMVGIGRSSNLSTLRRDCKIINDIIYFRETNNQRKGKDVPTQMYIYHKPLKSHDNF